MPSENSTLDKRSMRLKLGAEQLATRTSLALEPEFWEQVEAAAKRANQTLPVWISEVDKLRADTAPHQSLASAVRVQVLQELLALGRGR